MLTLAQVGWWRPAFGALMLLLIVVATLVGALYRRSHGRPKRPEAERPADRSDRAAQRRGAVVALDNAQRDEDATRASWAVPGAGGDPRPTPPRAQARAAPAPMRVDHVL